MGHPDQHTPDSHRTSQQPPEPEPGQELDADPALEEDADTGSDVRTPEPEGDRQGEAGNTYVGREMDDRLKTTPRIEDEDEVTDED